MNPIFTAAYRLAGEAENLLGVRDANKHIAVLTRGEELVLRVKTVYAKRHSWVRTLREFGGYRVVVELSGRAAATSAKKGWSVKDPDHIPIGSRVMLRVDPNTVHPDSAAVREAFGIPEDVERHGIVRKRWFRTGCYRVEIENSNHSITLTREQILYPVPANVLPLAPPTTNMRKWRRKIGAR